MKWVGWWGKVFLAGFDGGGWEKGGGGGGRNSWGAFKGVTVGGGLEKLSQGRNFFFWFRPRLNFLHMLIMNSRII